MILDSLFPVFALILLGHLLHRFGMIGDGFFQTSDRLVYYIFFPALLFWKIGGATTGLYDVGRLAFAGLSTSLLAFGLGVVAIRAGRLKAFQAGAFSQACYRFNTYVGMAVALTAVGDEGMRIIGILIGFMIPLNQLLAVSALIWYSGRRATFGKRLKITVTEVIANPLILACLAGFLYATTVNAFPVFVENTFRMMSLVTLPLALMAIGGNLTLASLRTYLPTVLGASAIKLVVLPAIGLLLLRALDIGGTVLQTTMLFFALPISPATYVLSAQLNSDKQLASALVAGTTLLSFFSLSGVLLLFF